MTSDLFRLTDEPMARLPLSFPKSYGRKRYKSDVCLNHI